MTYLIIMSEPLVAHEPIMFFSSLIVTHVIKLQLKRKGYPFSCFIFCGFTEKGLKAYWPIVEAELKAKRLANTTGAND